jgi:hypothetical protein
MLYFTAEYNVAMIKRKQAFLRDVYEVREQIISITQRGIKRFPFITSLHITETHMLMQIHQWF